MELKVGDILLKRGTAIGALIIRDLTSEGAPFDASYSHSGVYAGDGNVYDARWPVVGKHALDYENYDVYRVPALTSEQAAAVLAYCAKHEGTHYSIRGVVEEGLERVFHIPTEIEIGADEWCSTFVAHAFASAGILLTRKPLPVPNDIAWSIAVMKVGTGG